MASTSATVGRVVGAEGKILFSIAFGKKSSGVCISIERNAGESVLSFQVGEINVVSEPNRVKMMIGSSGAADKVQASLDDNIVTSSGRLHDYEAVDCPVRVVSVDGVSHPVIQTASCGGDQSYLFFKNDAKLMVFPNTADIMSFDMKKFQLRIERTTLDSVPGAAEDVNIFKMIVSRKNVAKDTSAIGTTFMLDGITVDLFENVHQLVDEAKKFMILAAPKPVQAQGVSFSAKVGGSTPAPKPAAEAPKKAATPKEQGWKTVPHKISDGKCCYCQKAPGRQIPGTNFNLCFGCCAKPDRYYVRGDENNLRLIEYYEGDYFNFANAIFDIIGLDRKKYKYFNVKDFMQTVFPSEMKAFKVSLFAQK